MIFSRKPIEHSNGLVGRAVHAADESIHSAQRAATAVVDGLADSAHALQRRTGDAVGQVSQRVDRMAQQGTQAMQAGTQVMVDKAHAASRQTLHYIERRPVKSVLIAVAAGAVLMALATLLARSRR